MITPPLSISARPDLTLNVPVSISTQDSPLPLRRRGERAPVLPGLRASLLEQPHARLAALLQPERLDAIRIRRLVLRVDPVGERLDERQQRRVRAHEGGAVRRVV